MFLDFRKAFDPVDHRIILRKLNNTGLPYFIIKWITSFLCYHKQRVPSFQSEWCNIKAGVPQGTLLGPVCFLLHINDLKTNCPAVKYVDDTTIWESCNRSGEDSHIQEAMYQTEEWSKQNNMQIN